MKEGCERHKEELVEAKVLFNYFPSATADLAQSQKLNFEITESGLKYWIARQLSNQATKQLSNQATKYDFCQLQVPAMALTWAA